MKRKSIHDELDERKRANIANQFMARRIAEFPTLYRNADAVILRCVIENMGSPEWNKDGILETTDRHYDEAKKIFTKYPLRMPIDTGFDLLNAHDNLLPNPHTFHGPISRLPNNCHEDWLEAIYYFLTEYNCSKYTPERIKHLAVAKCLYSYHVESNPHAGEPDRTIYNFTQFQKRIPNWLAQIEKIRFFKKHGFEDSSRFLGENI